MFSALGSEVYGSVGVCSNGINQNYYPNSGKGLGLVAQSASEAGLGSGSAYSNGQISNGQKLCLLSDLVLDVLDSVDALVAEDLLAHRHVLCLMQVNEAVSEGGREGGREGVSAVPNAGE